MERVQKSLAQAGIDSRRKCEELIKAGKVTVNGIIAKLGDKAKTTDTITVYGKPVNIEHKIYLALNKPRGVVTTVSEEHGMKTVMDIVKTKERVYPVGRLDKNTEGLLILTNYGELANLLTHPRYNVEKEYLAVLDKTLTEKMLERLQKGIMIDDKPVKINKINAFQNKATLVIHEGRKHIVRRLFEELGLYVKQLVRLRVATLSLGTLKPGAYRPLTQREIESLTSRLRGRHSKPL